MKNRTDLGLSSLHYKNVYLSNKTKFAREMKEMPTKLQVGVQQSTLRMVLNKILGPSRITTFSFLFFLISSFIALFIIHHLILFLSYLLFVKHNIPTTGIEDSKRYITSSTLIGDRFYKHIIESKMRTDDNSMFLSEQCHTVSENRRFDCFPQGTISQNECNLRGCCWDLQQKNANLTPHCFYPAKFRSYKLINVSASNLGTVAYLQMIKSSVYPKNIGIIKIDFNYWTTDILQVKVSISLSSFNLILNYDVIGPTYLF